MSLVTASFIQLFSSVGKIPLGGSGNVGGKCVRGKLAGDDRRTAGETHGGAGKTPWFRGWL